MDLHLADRRLILRGSAVVLTLAVIVLLFATAQTAFADGPGGVPDTPNGLEASAVHAGIVDIKWNEVEGAESYEVRVMPSGTWISLPGEGMEIAHYGAGAIVRNLPHEGRYYFSVTRSERVGRIRVVCIPVRAGYWDPIPVVGRPRACERRRHGHTLHRRQIERGRDADCGHVRHRRRKRP